MARVFLSYCHDNEAQVARLRQDLLDAGVEVWWDKEIDRGGDFRVAIREAMRQASHVVVCFSGETRLRGQTGIYPEVRDAIEIMRNRPPGAIFLIPVRLSECEIPDFSIDARTTLRNLLRVDLFPEEKYAEEFQALLRALRAPAPREPRPTEDRQSSEQAARPASLPEDRPPPGPRQPYLSLVWRSHFALFLLTVMTGSSVFNLANTNRNTSGQKVKALKGRLVELGEHDRDKISMVGTEICVPETNDGAKTGELGLFEITFSTELIAGQTITVLLRNRPEYVIINPDLFGKLRLPSNEMELVEIWAVSRRSQYILTDRGLEKIVERMKDGIARNVRQPGEAPGADRAAILEDLARTTGFTVPELLDRIRDWAKKAKADKRDPYELGLAAFAEQNYELARKYFLEDADLKTRGAARSLESAGESAYAEQKYEEAIQDYAKALVLLDPKRDQERVVDIRFKQANARLEFGALTNPATGKQSLREAIDVYRDLFAHIAGGDPIFRAAVQNSLGNALHTLAEDTEGPEGAEALTEALKLFEQALHVLPRERFPREWSATQSNRGAALLTQAMRTEGEAGVKLLGQAANAFHQALEVRTREHSAREWAGTQMNLGLVFSLQGQRTPGKEGVDLLNRAVDTFRQALQVQDREHSPRDWAMAQNGLGSALEILGERTEGKKRIDHLAEAAKAFQQALLVDTFEHAQQSWARAQNNLGIVLARQGDYTGGDEGNKLLAEAAVAFRQVLRVQTRGHLPQQWAMTQTNLGNVLELQASRTRGKEKLNLLSQAADACRQALQVQTRKQFPIDWANSQNSLGVILSSQGEHTAGAEGVKLLVAAAQAFRLSLEVRTREQFPRQWSEIQDNLGRVLCKLSRRSRGDERKFYLSNAINAYEQALTVFTPKADGQSFDLISFRLCRAQIDLALENGAWDQAANAAVLTPSVPGLAVARDARMVTVELVSGEFTDRLEEVDILAANDLKNIPDIAAELTVVRLVCQIALGQNGKAGDEVKSLSATIAKEPPDYHPDGPWLGLQNYIRQTKQEHLAANRDWLLKMLDALLLEQRDDVVKALKNLPDLK